MCYSVSDHYRNHDHDRDYDHDRDHDQDQDQDRDHDHDRELVIDVYLRTLQNVLFSSFIKISYSFLIMIKHAS